MSKNSGNKGKNKTWLIVSAALIAAAVVLLICARTVDGFAEWYSSSIYPLLVGTVGRLSGVFGFSAAEALVLILPIVIVGDLLRIAIRTALASAARSKSTGTACREKRLGGFWRRLLLLASILIFLYSANCGVNYYRDPFVSPEVYSDSSFTVEQLTDFCEYVAGQLQMSSEESGSLNESGFTYPDKTALAESAVSAMENLGNDYQSLSGYYPKPKSLSVLSRLFSAMGVSGIYSPFTIEANINGEMPGMETPFTACHELSHLKGYMNEGEANYIGWLACIGSDDSAFRRSGWLIAWNYAGNALFRADPDRFAEVFTLLPADALEELKENDDFWESHETKASEVQDKVNDAYLKSNGQADGISSYGKLTTLMLAWYTSN